MTIGFTGTRSGMSDFQKKTVTQMVKAISENNPGSLAIHGGCIGADIDFHHICDDLIREVYPGHFAKDPENKSHIGEFPGAHIVHESQTHFKRNRDIVDRCDILIATPYNNNQQGGTWYTINYAKKTNKHTILIERYEQTT